MAAFIADPTPNGMLALDLGQAQAYNANLNALLHEYKSAHQSACRSLVNASEVADSSAFSAESMDPQIAQLQQYII